MDEEVDLSVFRSGERKPNEELLPEDDNASAPGPNLDQNTINSVKF